MITERWTVQKQCPMKVHSIICIYKKNLYLFLSTSRFKMPTCPHKDHIKLTKNWEFGRFTFNLLCSDMELSGVLVHLRV